MHRALFPSVVAVVSAVSSLAAASPPPRYAFIDLGVPAGDSFSLAQCLNSKGDISFEGVAAPDYSVESPLVWSEGSAVALPVLAGATYSWVLGINDHGEQSGASHVGGHTYSVLWKDGALTALGGLPGKPYGDAWFLNDAGQVAGTSWNAGGGVDGHAYLWTPHHVRGTTGSFLDLGTLGGPTSTAQDINGRGEVVGYADVDTSGTSHAFVWEHGALTDLGSLGGQTSQAYNINDDRMIVGTADSATLSARNVYWKKVHGAWQITEAAVLAGFDYGGFSSNNQQGDVTGTDSKNDGTTHATLWHDGAQYDLNDLVPGRGQIVFVYGNCINDRGQIAATGLVGGVQHGFRLDPIGR